MRMIFLKIYIVGSIASGKSTFANKLSSELNIPYIELDKIVHIPDKNSLWGNSKREINEREELFASTINQPNWIIEDVGRPCFIDGMKRADIIILLEIPTKTREYRIIKRWIKQLLKIEQCIYKPRFEMLKCMLQWSKNYDTGKDNLLERLVEFQDKLVIIRNNKDIRKFINNF